MLLLTTFVALLLLLLPCPVLSAVEYFSRQLVNLPEEVPKAKQQLLDQLMHKYFDDLRQCCQSVNGNAGGSLDCEAIADQNRPTKTLTLNGQQEPVVKQFYYKCMAHGRDSRNCCTQSGVSSDCLLLCNAASPPADDALEGALVRCQQHKQAISKCFHWSMGTSDQGQMHFADQQQQQQQPATAEEEGQ